ncbi:MAG: SGNH/GDSL hydrolase family protein, partial [Pyrinomonadaceae bacterium]
LRWQSYDYVVTANSLGFPGPEPSQDITSEKFRILVTGDAFTSAEGVNTDQAWPRLLENKLNAKIIGKKVEVLNFAITGYGPNQYQAVIEEFAPKYRPDLIIVETFVNDFQDVLRSDDEFRNSIGFGQPSAVGVKSILRLEHLRRWMDLKLTEPIEERVISQFPSQSYFLGNFKSLERGHPEVQNEATELFASRLQMIKSSADQQGAEVIVVMVPAPVQVCTPSQLAYYPKNVDLSDGTKFDIDLPQRLMGELTTRYNVPFYDLRDAFSETGGYCPYQQHNMHWTVNGHQIVSDYIANVLINKYVH